MNERAFTGMLKTICIGVNFGLGSFGFCKRFDDVL